MRRCSTRLPSFSCTSWKCTVLDSVAEYTFTGTVSSPKAIVPFQIERGFFGTVPAFPVPPRLMRQNGRRRRLGVVGHGLHDRRGLVLGQQRRGDGERDHHERERPP